MDKVFAKRLAIIVGIIAVVVLVDSLTKQYFSASLGLGQSAESAIPALFQYKLIHNSGAAWGIFEGNAFMLGITSSLTTVVFAICTLIFIKKFNMIMISGLALVIAGGIGNLIDRFSLGYVVDFIDLTFMDFPVFNAADIAVTIGAIVFVVGFIKREFFDLKAKDGALCSTNLDKDIASE